MRVCVATELILDHESKVDLAKVIWHIKFKLNDGTPVILYEKNLDNRRDRRGRLIRTHKAAVEGGLKSWVTRRRDNNTF